MRAGGDVSAPARLLGLRVQGFKSFAERTLVEFGPGISAVVGPNGSGKSNLADALRWALGEQGRSLRIRKSEDVIWAGSERRSAQGMADVTLVLENGDALLPVEYAVVELGRRLYRSGENDYLLNKQRVRLRDLQDLLDSANIAENAFLFIGQGMVDQALALRPEERRPLFEEVAGVRRHERRRRKAEDQLAEAEANLARVEDILAELRPQARRLGQLAEQQATRLTAGEELAAALIAAAHGRWHEAAGRAAEAERRRDALRLETERSLEALEAAESSVAGIATSMAERAELERERRVVHEAARADAHRARTARGAGDRRDRRGGAGSAADRGRASRRRCGRGPAAAHPRGAGARAGPGAGGRAGRRGPVAVRGADGARVPARRVARPGRRAGRAPARRGGAGRRGRDGPPTSRGRRAPSGRRAGAGRRGREPAGCAGHGPGRGTHVAGGGDDGGGGGSRRARLGALGGGHGGGHPSRRCRAIGAGRLDARGARGRLEQLARRLDEEEDRGIARAARKLGGKRVDEDLGIEPSLRPAVEAALGELARAYVVERGSATMLAGERGHVVVRERLATADKVARWRDAPASCAGWMTRSRPWRAAA